METKSIFTTIAEGVGNTNQNVVELYTAVSELRQQIAEIHSALFPIAPDEDGSPE
jgi:hypothetical protein